MTVAMLDEFRQDRREKTSGGRLLILLEEFLDSHRDPDTKKGTPRDIEQVFETLALLENIAGTSTALLSNDLPPLLRRPEALLVLKDELQTYVRRKCLVRPESLRPLLGFRKIFERFDSLEVFTVNYDVVVELLCEQYGVPYADGFQLYWDEKQFDQAPVRIYKLHGSAIWFQSPREGYLKVPLRFDSNKVERLSGENANPLMMYPAEKWDDSEVFLALHSRFHKVLRDSEWMVAVGYSFRDEHLNHAILEEVRANPDLKIILISPGAEKVYATHLRPHAALEIELPQAVSRPLLERRVIRLPFRWESILEDFAGTWYSDLEQTFTWYLQGKRQIADKSMHRLPELAIKLWEIGAFEQAQDISAAIDVGLQPENWRLRYFSSRAAVLYSVDHLEEAQQAWDSAQSILRTRYVRNLAVQFTPGGAFLGFVPAPAPQIGTFAGASMIHGELENVLGIFDRYSRYTIGEARHEWLAARYQAIRAIFTYFVDRMRGTVPWGAILDSRRTSFKTEVEAIEAFLHPLDEAQRIARKGEVERLFQHLESRALEDEAFGRLPAVGDPGTGPTQPSGGSER